MIQTDVDLAPLTTLHLKARAQAYAQIHSLLELQEAIAWAKTHELPYCILSGGSNLVFAQDYAGLVIQLNLRGCALEGETDSAWLIRAAAGENWHQFVAWTLQHNYPGLENLALIPGNVGAAPIQNIGAYGLEMAERFASLEAYDPLSHQVVHLARDACEFGYRHSLFKIPRGQHLIILSVCFALPKQWQPQLRYKDVQEALDAKNITNPKPADIFEAVVAIRRAKLPDPAELGNAGSFFKNPIVSATQAAALKQQFPQLPIYPHTDDSCKLAAGYLIDQAGWKAYRRGKVGVHAKQALVLVNYDDASGAELLQLAHTIQADILRRYGVALEMEPVVR